MDIDAILARRPALVLVDELAHTNAPGSRHTKRYQDVEELLGNRLMQNQAGPGNAGLALVVEDGERRTIHRSREVGIVEPGLSIAR